MNWDDCKRQTVSMENEIDKKLLNFSKLTITSYSDGKKKETFNSKTEKKKFQLKI